MAINLTKGLRAGWLLTLKVMDDEHAQDMGRAIIDLYHALGRLLQ